MTIEVYIDQLKIGQPVVLYQAKSSCVKKKRSPLLGLVILIIGFSGLILSTSPMISAQIKYGTASYLEPQNVTTQKISQVNNAVYDFNLTIPKIQLNAPVLTNIDPYNEKEYLKSLELGLAHAKGTGLPGQGETIYIFGHSSRFIWDNNPYGAVFYLLGKLNKADKIIITYNGKPFLYQVSEKKIMEGNDFSLLNVGVKERLVLQTCWPPASNWKRLVVIAEPLETLTYKY